MTRTIQANLGRITHISFGQENAINVIFRGLKGNMSFSTKSFLYHFNNVDIFNISEKIIYGEIYKSKLSSEHKVLDKSNLTYNSEIIDEFFSMSRFVIFNDLSIVFTSNYHLKDDDFINVFKNLYSRNADEYASKIEIHYRKKDFDIFEKINSFSRLVEVELINIRKSNPTPKPTYEKIEALLNREKTDVLNAKLKSENQDGLARDLNSLIMSAISIADSGYGDSIIVGQNFNNDIEKIKLKDFVIRKRIENIPIEENQKFINLIVTRFRKYISPEDDLIHD